VWGIPWISNEVFPGLAYCIGGRSLFWGGWSPRLTADDLARWPQDLANFLLGPDGYVLTEREVGVAADAAFIMHIPFHDFLLAALLTAQPQVPTLAAIEEAPLAVEAGAPGPGLFAFDKFSSANILIDAVRDDAANNAGMDVNRRLFVVPRTHVVRLNLSGNTISSLDLVSDGIPRTLVIPPNCAVVLAAGTVESTRLALDSLGVGSTTFGTSRAGNLMAHLRSNITVRIKRTALGLPAGAPADLETTAFLVRGKSGGRQFHFQISAAATGGTNPEKNMWEQIPDVEFQDHIRAIQDPNWITIVLRGIGEMVGNPNLSPDPAASWIDLSSEVDEVGRRRAYVNLVKISARGRARRPAGEHRVLEWPGQCLAAEPTSSRSPDGWILARPTRFDAPRGGDALCRQSGLIGQRHEREIPRHHQCLRRRSGRLSKPGLSQSFAHGSQPGQADGRSDRRGGCCSASRDWLQPTFVGSG